MLIHTFLFMLIVGTACICAVSLPIHNKSQCHWIISLDAKYTQIQSIYNLMQIGNQQLGDNTLNGEVNIGVNLK